MVSHAPREVPIPTAGSSRPTHSERWLLSAMRRWASLRLAGQRPQTSIAPELADQASGRVAALFMAWMQAVELEARRPMEIHRPGCGGISPDEQRLVVACGLAPVAPDLGARLLEPMLLNASQVMGLGRALNAGLCAAGLSLPVRLVDDAPAVKRAAAGHTLH